MALSCESEPQGVWFDVKTEGQKSRHTVPENDSAPKFWLPECRIIRHEDNPVPDWKKLTMPELFRYRIKETQSGIFLVRYWTEMKDARMPMPALVF
jgi:hypothetical protein